MFKEQLKKYQERIENILKVYTPSDSSGYHDQVNEAMAYSLMAGGKRIRPTIILSIYEMFMKKSENFEVGVEAFAGAMEMIHTYSLIHDDLPAMDDDDLRRGKPTCHVKYGEDMAILAGDGLLNRAYEIMIESTIDHHFENRGLLASKCLGVKAGSRGMIGGQVADISYENKPVDMDVIKYIHYHKTSALLEASFMMGGYLAGQGEAVIAKLEQIGRNVGLAFQIQDDLLDITSTEEELGKPIMSDQKNNKTTYVDLKGVEQSKADIDDLLGDTVELIKSFKIEQGCDITFLLGFIEYLKHRTH